MVENASPQLCILCCQGFQAEFTAAAQTECWDDVVVSGFPVNCGKPPLSWSEVRDLLPETCTQLVLLGVACLKGLEQPPAGFPKTRIIPREQCFHLVASEPLVNDSIANGSYLITPSWLKDWRARLNKLGFEPEYANEFFHDFAQELVLLDTSFDPELTGHLADLQSIVSMPIRHITVGLEHTRLQLARIVLEWRLEQAMSAIQEQNRLHNSQLADHVAAMDMLTQLARTHHEVDAIVTIQDLFNMLFAPLTLHYLRVENGIFIPDSSIPQDLLAAMCDLDDDYAWTQDEKGFLLRIRSGDKDLGRIIIGQLSFPEYRQRYLNLALAITGICGLAIENARNRQRLLQMEKMASLGIVVAGVAHDINTPLGVSLTAASTLQDQSRHLAERFKSRTMTQSDLDTYLKHAAELTMLMLLNLERISQLTDTFRQVALDGKPVEKQRFRIRECLDKVIVSMGDLLSNELVTINITCDPELEIESLPDDWANIFINLISNSIKHGFKDRDNGIINITMILTPKALLVTYADNGVGLKSETLARMFDPFYTTNLQNGMGLGMYLVYNLITYRMAGNIVCQSQPGQGVSFQISIPL